MTLLLCSSLLQREVSFYRMLPDYTTEREHLYDKYDGINYWTLWHSIVNFSGSSIFIVNIKQLKGNPFYTKSFSILTVMVNWIKSSTEVQQNRNRYQYFIWCCKVISGLSGFSVLWYALHPDWKFSNIHLIEDRILKKEEWIKRNSKKLWR